MMSLYTWCILFSDLGLTQAVSRQLPQHIREMDALQQKAFFGRLVAMRGVTGLVLGLLYAILCPIFLPDLPVAGLVLFGAGVMIFSLADPLFSWLLGINRANQWSTSFLLRRTQYLLWIPAGYWLGGLAGAASGVALTEFVLLALGRRWTRGLVDTASIQLDVRALWPLLRVALVLHAGNLLAATSRFTGETLLKLATHNYVEIGYYGVCLNLHIAAEATLIQLCAAVTPFMTMLLVEKRHEAFQGWVERLMTGLGVLSVLLVLTVFLMGDHIIPRLLGVEFAPAVRNLYPLSLSAIAISAGTVGATLAVVFKRHRAYIVSQASRLVIFWPLGWVLAKHYNSWGACIAFTLGTFAFAACVLIAVHRTFRLPMRRWFVAIGAGLPLLGLFALKGSGLRDLMLWAVAVATYSLFVVKAKLLKKRTAV